jgi:hypothetical protein
MYKVNGCLGCDRQTDGRMGCGQTDGCMGCGQTDGRMGGVRGGLEEVWAFFFFYLLKDI